MPYVAPIKRSTEYDVELKLLFKDILCPVCGALEKYIGKNTTFLYKGENKDAQWNIYATDISCLQCGYIWLMWQCRLDDFLKKRKENRPPPPTLTELMEINDIDAFKEKLGTYMASIDDKLKVPEE